MGEIVYLNIETTLPVPCARVLQGAIEADLSFVMVIGCGDGKPYYASSSTDAAEMLLRLERFKQVLLERAK